MDASFKVRDIYLYIINRAAVTSLTLCFDGCRIDRCVGVTGQKAGLEQILADAPCCPSQLSGLQVERLSGLHCKLWTPAMSHWGTMRTLPIRKSECFSICNNTPLNHRVLSAGINQAIPSIPFYHNSPFPLNKDVLFWSPDIQNSLVTSLLE